MLIQTEKKRYLYWRIFSSFTSSYRLIFLIPYGPMCIVGSQLSKVERETEVKKLSTQQIIIDKELVEEETMDDIRY